MDINTLILALVLVAVVIVGYLFLNRTNAIDLAMNQRLDVEKQVADSIKKVENILAGSSTKGSAGENIVELAFSKLPADWQVRNLPINNKRVEFAVRLPDKLMVPIDSKWPATDLLEQFLASQNIDEKRKLKAIIHSKTKERAREIRKYLEPGVTTPFGLVVVPEPIFELCSEILPTLFEDGVILLSYNMFIPYILLVVQMTLRVLQRPDLRQLDGFVKEATEGLNNLQEALQTKFSSATGTLENFRIEMAKELRNLNVSLSALQRLEPASTSDNGNPEATFEAGA